MTDIMSKESNQIIISKQESSTDDSPHQNDKVIMNVNSLSDIVNPSEQIIALPVGMQRDSDLLSHEEETIKKCQDNQTVQLDENTNLLAFS